MTPGNTLLLLLMKCGGRIKIQVGISLPPNKGYSGLELHRHGMYNRLKFAQGGK